MQLLSFRTKLGNPFFTFFAQVMDLKATSANQQTLKITLSLGMTKSEMWVSNVVAAPLGVLILVCLQITILATPFHQLRRMNIRNCMITSKIRRLLSKLKEVGAKEALSTLMKMIRLITTLKVRTLYNGRNDSYIWQSQLWD